MPGWEAGADGRLVQAAYRLNSERQSETVRAASPAGMAGSAAPRG